MSLDELLESEKVEVVRKTDPGAFETGAGLGRDIGVGLVMSSIGLFYVFIGITSRFFESPYLDIWNWLIIGLPLCLFMLSCLRFVIMLKHPLSIKAPILQPTSVSSRIVGFFRWGAFVCIFITSLGIVLFPLINNS